MDGVALGFEIALGFVLFVVVCVVGFFVLGLLIRIPIWFCERVAKELRQAFSPQGRRNMRTAAVYFLTGLGLVVALLFVASLFFK
jgi:hypothetical protein